MITYFFFAQDSVDGASGFQLFDFFTRLGMAGVFIYLYYEERKERRASQDRERESHESQTQMMERMLPIITEATSTLVKVTEVQETLTERAAGTHRTDELTVLIEQMKSLSRELRSAQDGG